MLDCIIVFLINFEGLLCLTKFENAWAPTEKEKQTKTTTNLLDFVALVGHDPGQLIAVDIVHERHPNVHAPLVHVMERSGMGYCKYRNLRDMVGIVTFGPYSNP